MSSLPRTLHEIDGLSGERTADDAPRPRGSAGARGLARAASGSLALNVANTAASVVATIVLARLMELANFGIYAWVVATVTLLTVPAIFGMDRLLVREVSVYADGANHAAARGLVRRSLQLVLLGAGVMIGVGLLIGLVVNGADTPLIVLAVGLLALPALALLRTIQSALMGMHRIVMGQLSELLLRPVLFLVLVGGVALAGIAIDATLALILFGVSAMVALFASYIMLRRALATLRPAAPTYETRRWLAAAAGLVLIGGGVVVNGQLGVVMLGLLDTPESAGLYAVAQRGALLVAFPLLALNAALAPRAARLWSAGRRKELQRLITLGSRGVLLLCLPAVAVFVLAGGLVLSAVFGETYVAGAPALAILSLGQLANVATGSVATVLIMTGHERRAGVGIVAGMAVNLVLGVALIPTFHAAGAAVAAGLGLVVSNAVHVVLARRTLGLDTTALGLPVRTVR